MGDPAGARSTGLPVHVGYGVGQIAGQVFRDLPSLLLLFFMTSVLGIAPDVAGIVIFVPKLCIGLLCDVGVGIMSDRMRHRFARRWWLLAGVLLSPLAMILLFHVPDGSETEKLVYLAATFSLYMVVFASFSVPYLAISGELTKTAEERNHVMAWRLVFTAIGVLIAGAIAPGIVAHNGGGQGAYETMSIVLAVICPAALLVAFIATRHASNRAPETTGPLRTLEPGAAFAKIFRTRFSVLLLANLLQLTGAGMGYAALLYFLAYNLGLGQTGALSTIGIIVIAACAGIILAQPMWIRAAAMMGKRNAYIIATFIYLLTYVFWGMSAGWPKEASYAFSFIAAIGNSGWAMLGFSMMSDVAAEEPEYAGLYAAAWIASDKIAFALGGTLLIGIILTGFGFSSQLAVLGQPQPDTALVGVLVAFAFCPVVLNLLAAGILWRFGDIGLKPSGPQAALT
jgi:GPH family glycoside/pentoside/hexuronide:cation symporter